MPEYIVYVHQEYKPSSKLVENEIDMMEVWIGPKWLQMTMPEICPEIKEWKVTQFRLGENKRSSILKEISHISFPVLRMMAIWNNAIYTLECFPFMDMPSLEWINFGLNNLTNVKPLRKATFPTLKQIHFRSYEIMQMKIIFLTLMGFHKCIVKTYKKQVKNGEEKNISKGQISDGKSNYKPTPTTVQVNIAQDEDIASKRRLNCTVIKKALKRKYKDLSYSS